MGDGLEAVYLLFALMVVGIVLVVVFLFFRKKKMESSIPNEEDLAKKEEKVMMLYFEVEDMINGLKEYVDNANQMLELQFKRLETEARNIRLMQESLQGSSGVISEISNNVEPEPDTGSRSMKKGTEMELYNQVALLMQQNKSEDEIAEALHISKSEIRFMLKLFNG